MPSFLPHIVAPALLALAFFPMARRRILMWAPIVWLPDLDYFFAVEYHRALLSNIFIPLGVATALVVLWRRRDPAAAFWEFAFRPGAPGALLLVAYYLSGHILMDVFAGGVVLFWPLTELNVYSFFAIQVDTATNQPTVFAESGTEDGIPQVTSTYTWLSAVDTAIGAFLLAALLGWGAWRLWRRARGWRSPVVVERKATIQKP